MVQRTVFCVALILVAAGEAPAQLLQGTIDGNVTDSSQAAIPAAIVTAKDEQTKFIRETNTNSVGGYSLPGLPPGTYTITVSSAGSQSYTQTGIAVRPNTIRRVDVTLNVGQVSESVTIVASAAALQTDRAEIRSDITGNTLINVGADRAQLPVAHANDPRHLGSAERELLRRQSHAFGELLRQRDADQHQQLFHRRHQQPGSY